MLKKLTTGVRAIQKRGARVIKRSAKSKMSSIRDKNTKSDGEDKGDENSNGDSGGDSAGGS